jgi:S1-C subfamily serine protease
VTTTRFGRLWLAACLALLGLSTAAAGLGARDAEYRAAVQALNRGDYPSAVERLRRLADHGHPRAQWALGYVYEHGLGVPRDRGKAEYWQRRATEGLLGRPVERGPPGIPESAVSATGSGIVVDADGQVLTSHHVVSGCRDLRVQSGGTAVRARPVTSDPRTDLALLATDEALPGQPAVFRRGPAASLGEPVMLAGFPLRGFLSDELQVVAGMVSALAGPRGDSRFLQLSAPVHPGNSGGPVLDDAGRVIGLVASTLDPKQVTRATGLPPQSIGFAVRGELVHRFLDAAGVAYRTTGTGTRLDTQTIAARARGFTVLVGCLR